MIHEFAATPQTFGRDALAANPGNDQALLAFLQGVRDSGVLADLSSGAWKQATSTEIANCPWPNRNELISLFQVLDSRGRLVPRGALGPRPVDEKTWGIEVANSHFQSAFHGIVVSSKSALAPLPNPPHPSTELAGVLASAFWSARKPTVRLRRTQAGFRAALAPVLRHALKISFVDPNLFSCPLGTHPSTSRFVRGIEAALQGAAAGRHATLTRVELHAPVNETSERTPGLRPWRQVAAEIKAKALGAGLRPGTFETWLWEIVPGGQEFHNRAILTNYCSIEVPNGLDVARTAGSSDRWTVLGQEEHENLRLDFSLNSPVFRLALGGPILI